jgi:hypothetical protein
MLQTTNQTTTKTSNSKNYVNRADLDAALATWGAGLVEIATARENNQDYRAVAERVIRGNYNYDQGTVLFKPTLASLTMFRGTFEGALSYFVGGNSKFAEDNGFALNPWVEVKFEIAGCHTGDDYGIVMGNKLLKDKTGKVTIANFTMGFVKNEDGKLKINLHHSSLPYRS